MRRTPQFVKLAMAIIFALGAAQAASAQAVPALGDLSRVELFAGYSYVRANTVVTSVPISMNGGSASLAYNFNNWLGVVGDVGAYTQGGVTANNFSLTVSTYQAGPRISLRKNPHLIPFGQVLLGGGHASGTLYTTSLGGGLAPLGTSNAFVLTAGVGLDWRVNRILGIRLLQAEYLYTQFQNGANHGNEQNNARLSTGIVFSFGKR